MLKKDNIICAETAGAGCRDTAAVPCQGEARAVAAAAAAGDRAGLLPACLPMMLRVNYQPALDKQMQVIMAQLLGHVE
jgi:hypothetical protein